MTDQGTNDPRFARLPKWAQSEIQRLEANVNHWKEKANHGPEDSNTFADQYYDENGKPLGRDTRITFELGDGIEFQAKIVTRNFKKPALEIMSSGIMGRGLVVLPWVTNVVYIQSSED